MKHNYKIPGKDCWYGGTQFRSITEATFARILSERLLMRWEYEPFRVLVDDAQTYVPDFWLPDEHCFVELRGEETRGQSTKPRAFWQTLMSWVRDEVPRPGTDILEAGFYYWYLGPGVSHAKYVGRFATGMTPELRTI